MHFTKCVYRKLNPSAIMLGRRLVLDKGHPEEDFESRFTLTWPHEIMAFFSGEEYSWRPPLEPDIQPARPWFGMSTSSVVAKLPTLWLMFCYGSTEGQYIGKPSFFFCGPWIIQRQLLWRLYDLLLFRVNCEHLTKQAVNPFGWRVKIKVATRWGGQT